MRGALTRYFGGWGPIPLRLALGTILMARGWAALTGSPEAAAAAVSGPALSVWLTVLAELVGGLFLVVGLFTRAAATLAAGLILIAMVDAGVAVVLPGPFELALALLAIAASLILTGGGRLSLDRDVLGSGEGAR